MPFRPRCLPHLLLTPLVLASYILVSHLNTPRPASGMREYLFLNNIPALRTLPYFPVSFVDEQIAAYNAWQWDDRGWYTINYSGTWFHSADGHRITPGQPTDAQRRIYVLGDSVVLGLYLSDDDTLTAALQRRVGHSYRVVNFGAI